jgi:hypothetical protein
MIEVIEDLRMKTVIGMKAVSHIIYSGFCQEGFEKGDKCHKIFSNDRI